MRRVKMWFQTAKRVFRTPSAKLGGIFFAVIVIACVFAPVFAPYDPTAMDIKCINATPSRMHICGTDSLGRDIFSRLLYGGRYSLSLGLIASIVGMILGIVIGSIAGYFGGFIENLIMRAMDILSSIPGVLLAIIISAALGPGFINTIIAMSVGGIPGNVRLIRGQILGERGKEYLEAAESINCSRMSIMFKHLLPNVVSPMLVSFTMSIGFMITSAASLSYIGLGVQPPTPEWGAMLSEGTAKIMEYPHLLLFPGIMIGLCVLSINLMGDGLRDALDPKLRD
ncbi:MAG: ABC transporter permease [Lachnospiraceae bacterium]|nr:ABC transporter permease [Lachnospiraceae bacterium]